MLFFFLINNVIFNLSKFYKSQKFMKMLNEENNENTKYDKNYWNFKLMF
jgi:hypothetical protein